MNETPTIELLKGLQSLSRKVAKELIDFEASNTAEDIKLGNSDEETLRALNMYAVTITNLRRQLV